MQSNALISRGLGEAYWREGRAQSLQAGEAAVIDDLSAIASIFEGTEAHLVAIDATASRIERRIMNTARYMDRGGRASEAKIADVMKLVARTAQVDPGPARLSIRAFPMGPAHIPLPRRERVPIPPSEVRKIDRDPAFELFMAAKADYVRRTRVTPQGLSAFIQRNMPASGSFRGSDIEIVSVDDFVSFQRLRELPSIFDGTLGRVYSIEFLDARLSNSWIECQDFVVSARRDQKRIKRAA